MADELPPFIRWMAKAFFDPKDKAWFGSPDRYTFFGDLLIAAKQLGPYDGAAWPETSHADKYDGDAEAQAAIDRLARRYFSRRAVFHESRWRLLEDVFEIWRKEQHSRAAPARYRDLVVPSLVQAIYGGEWIDEPHPAKVYPRLRLEVRKDIERNLLGGQTLDRAYEMKYANLPDEDTPEMRRLERIIKPGIREMTAEDWVERLDAIARLPNPDERDALTERLSGSTDSEQAKRTGVSVAAVRQRISRALRRLRRI